MTTKLKKQTENKTHERQIGPCSKTHKDSRINRNLRQIHHEKSDSKDYNQVQTHSPYTDDKLSTLAVYAQRISTVTEYISEDDKTQIEGIQANAGPMIYKNLYLTHVRPQCKEVQ